MAIVMEMHWPGLSQEHYNARGREVNFEEFAPMGDKYRAAWNDDGSREDRFGKLHRQDKDATTLP